MTTREELFTLIDEELHEIRARNVAARLTDFHRTFGSSGYKSAMDIVVNKLEHAGVDDLEVDEVDIEHAYEPHAAELWIDAPEREKLVDFETAPASLATWSSPTPESGERLEIVDVGTGEQPEDFKDVDVEGKAVFVHGTRRRQGWQKAAELAAENGASGIVTDYMLWQTPDVREPALVPEVVQLLRLNPNEFFLDRDIWAFSISHAASVKLQSLLEEGSVHLEATVDAEVYDTTAPIAEATIQGADIPDERILFCAHASGIRPGCNCAEGVGLTVEIVRAISKLIEDGTIDRPRRSITFIFGAEGAVSRNYLDENPDAEQNVVTSLTYCSTGHKQEDTDSSLLLSQSPDSVRSFINDYLAELGDVTPKEADWVGKEAGKELPLIRFQQHYYTPWSDNTRFASAGIPAPLFMSWPDRYFHSQKLTEDRIDPSVLRRAGLLSGVAALELADADQREAESIAEAVAGRAIQRQTALSSRYRTGDADAWARRQLAYLADRDTDAFRSVTELTDTDISETLDELEAELQGVHERVTAEMPSPTRSDPPSMAELVPVRETDGSVGRWPGLEYEELIEIADLLADADNDAGWESIRVVSDEAWNFVNGERTVGEIADAVGFEFDIRVTVEPIHRILSGHADAGNLRFERPDREVKPSND